MKKLLILLLASLVTAGMAFAQSNESSVEQTGDDNDAYTTQTGASNDATIEQAGDENDGSILQNNADNLGVIWQYGDDNSATVAQDGIEHTAYILQGYFSTGAANHNVSSLTQEGTDNWAYLYLAFGDNNEATVVQENADNVAYVIQGWGEGDVPNDVVNYNSASISQFSSNNDGRIFQYNGDNNTATVTQQNGNSNNGQISQGYLWTVHDVDISEANFNIANINQAGDMNNATVMQLGDQNVFDLAQNGSGNIVGEEGRVASGANWFRQDGNFNEFAGVTNSGGELSFDMSISAVQNNGATLDYDTEGITGYYGSFQRGDFNQIGLMQGENDWALIQQLGSSNLTLLYQNGGANESTVLQHGNNNTSEVIQTSN